MELQLGSGGFFPCRCCFHCFFSAIFHAHHSTCFFFFFNQGSEQGDDVEATVGKRQISSQWPWRSSVQFRISVSNKVMALCRVCHSHRICDLVSDYYVTSFDLFSIISYIILEHLVFSTSEHPLEHLGF